MIPLTEAPPALALDQLTLFCTHEPLLEGLPVLVFYGPSTTINTTQNSSRIQAHIYSLAGFHSFPRLTVSPTSPLYAAVNNLPNELQGDEIYRGLAIGLLSYFAKIPRSTKSILKELAATHHPRNEAPAMFDEMHAADLASKMHQIEKVSEIATHLTSARMTRALSWVDMDVILPSGTLRRLLSTDVEATPLSDDNGLPLFHYGQYTSLIESLGALAFLPTTKLQRAPSKPTAHSRSKVLSKDQKVSLRREMCEFVDTENNYLQKLRDLAGRVRNDFHPDTPSDIWQALFPRCLVSILDVNESFFQEIQSILDNTESEAINDIEGGNFDSVLVPDTVQQGRRRDLTGTTLFAKAIHKWAPDFRAPYQEYLRASAGFFPLISRSSADSSSRFSACLQRFGEQHLKSLLIEPVQRLPRYSLLIGNLSLMLPVSHPALASLLKARDIITDICALDQADAENSVSIHQYLQTIVRDWSGHVTNVGRLITAVDVVELRIPYVQTSQGLPAILLIFPGKVALLHKMGDNATSARGLLAEIDHNQSHIANDSRGSAKNTTLRFESIHDLRTLRVEESVDGLAVYFTELPQVTLLPHQTLSVRTRVLSLQAPYHGKASRLTEELVKAAIEGRYPVEIRESDKWSLRCVDLTKDGIGVFAAISESKNNQSLFDQSRLGWIQLHVDSSAGIKSRIADDAPSIVLHCSMDDSVKTYLLQAESSEGARSTAKCTAETIVSALQKQLQDMLQSPTWQNNVSTVQQEASFNASILAALPINNEHQLGRPKSFRPRSPVKLLSNMLSSSGLPPKTPYVSCPRAPTNESIPCVPYPVQGTSALRSVDVSPAKRVAVVDRYNENYKSPLALLEDTFTAYIVALRSRSGNVVGKILQARANADELIVNELYNALLEDPDQLEAAAIATVDVLFAAFEKFLRRAWRERMGPLLPPTVAKDMQSSFDAGKPVEFARRFRQSLDEMSPQNRRAFAATMKLLSDLLDASGNDGDRGVLIASFSEALVLVGNPHDYIMLLDRLVEDHDNLFEDDIEAMGGPSSATSSLNRSRSFNTGSLTSNASSLRRKLGLGPSLSRENSKSESESKVASIWRTLSKNSRSPGDVSQSTSASSKTSLVRSRSNDMDKRALVSSRPTSRDRPLTSGSLASDGSHSRPGSSHLNISGLSSIGEDTPSKISLPQRKKRRSSLSDLHTLKQNNVSGPIAPLQSRNLQKHNFPQGQLRSVPSVPSPGKPNGAQQPARDSPHRSGIPRFTSPSHKENSPAHVQSTSKNVTAGSGPVTITSYTPQRRISSKTNTATPRAGLNERSWPQNRTNSPKQKSPSPQKLRMQSPQKLRQRLSQEQKSTTTADANLQAEMSKIGEELSALKRPGSSGGKGVKATISVQQQATLQDLSTRLQVMQTQLQKHTTESATQQKATKTMSEALLLISEKKVRNLEELYKEANAENEALYDRFNDELGKILGRVRKGEGVQEMRTQLKEAQGEAKRLKEENSRLEREVVGLKSLLPGD